MKTKESFIPFMPTSALFSNGINYSFISRKYNLFRLVCYANNLSLGGEVFYNVQAFCFSLLLKSISASLNMSATAAAKEK